MHIRCWKSTLGNLSSTAKESSGGIQVKDHARQILEKHIGKPFFDGWYSENQARMTEKEVKEGLAWLEDRFYVIRHEDDGLPSVDWVLDLARAAVLR